jgi:hypothetical protein
MFTCVGFILERVNADEWRGSAEARVNEFPSVEGQAGELPKTLGDAFDGFEYCMEERLSD